MSKDLPTCWSSVGFAPRPAYDLCFYPYNIAYMVPGLIHKSNFDPVRTSLLLAPLTAVRVFSTEPKIAHSDEGDDRL